MGKSKGMIVIGKKKKRSHVGGWEGGETEVKNQKKQKEKLSTKNNVEKKQAKEKK